MAITEEKKFLQAKHITQLSNIAGIAAEGAVRQSGGLAKAGPLRSNNSDAVLLGITAEGMKLFA